MSLISFSYFQPISMKKIFIRTAYDRMQNAEFQQLCCEIQNILTHYDLQGLKLEPAVGHFNKIIASLLGLLSPKVRKMPQTVSMDVARKRLDDLVSSLLLYAKALQRAGFPEQQQSVQSCVPYLRTHFKQYVYANELVKSGMLRAFLKEYNQNSEFYEAAQQLGIHRFVVEIKDNYQLLSDKFMERIQQKAAHKQTGGATKAKEELIAELKFLLFSIEMAAKVNPDINYGDLIKRINKELIDARGQLRNRATRRKTRLAKEQKGPQQTIETPD